MAQCTIPVLLVLPKSGYAQSIHHYNRIICVGSLDIQILKFVRRIDEGDHHKDGVTLALCIILNELSRKKK